MTLTWAITTFGPLLLAALSDWLLKSRKQATDDANAKALGASTVTAQINKESADASRRASDAVTNAPDLDQFLADLKAGTI